MTAHNEPKSSKNNTPYSAMQRRKVDPLPSDTKNGLSSATSPSKTPGKKDSFRKRNHAKVSLGNVVLVTLLVASLLIGAATYFFPSQVESVELETAKKTKNFVHNAYEMEQEMEKQVGGLWGGDGGHSQPNDKDATASMEQQPSSWVEGEKKLKQKLQVLYERQQQGKDLGVPVLTRWLGEDIPAWPGEGVDVKKWKKQVDAKYKEMAATEMKWRAEMKKLHEQTKR